MTEPHHVFKIFNVSPNDESNKLSNRIVDGIKSSELEDNGEDEDVAKIQIQQIGIQSDDSESSYDLKDDTTEQIESE